MIPDLDKFRLHKGDGKMFSLAECQRRTKAYSDHVSGLTPEETAYMQEWKTLTGLRHSQAITAINIIASTSVWSLVWFKIKRVWS